MSMHVGGWQQHGGTVMDGLFGATVLARFRLKTSAVLMMAMVLATVHIATANQATAEWLDAMGEGLGWLMQELTHAISLHMFAPEQD